MNKTFKQNQQYIELKELQTELNEQLLTSISGGAITLDSEFSLTTKSSFGFVDNRSTIEQIKDLFGTAEENLSFYPYIYY